MVTILWLYTLSTTMHNFSCRN